MVPNRLYLILHGHFYQPPREDPWTAEIDRQPSAVPFHDWNERINKQCYAANAASRVLDSHGRIEAIINNYEYFSYNFGPTLFDWLVKYDPFTARQIVDADRKSMERNNGHGNAIAQVYNHIIMPLASDQDKITQIEWGLKHFEVHFGRKSEGIWLAETAVNDRVAEFLIDYGIKFIILAPTQAKEVCPLGSDEWTDVSHNSIDPSKPYILRESNGEIAVFFYYGDIASKLSFQHLLQKVDYLRGELLVHNNPEKEIHLVNVATDGETYGHHEPFGDMCMSRFIHENETEKDFIFTNYARFLEIQPPADYVRLKEGNENLGTAWSCAHGVDRWRKNCGCSAGGPLEWNQSWREPLRNALDFLRDKLIEVVQKELSRYLRDMWAARNDYIWVVMAPNRSIRDKALNEFFAKHAKTNLSPTDRSFVLRLMEALRNELLMYTSCGWFFSEVSGIETVQDMAYAGRIFDLVGDILPAHTHDSFLNILHKAKSNVTAFQDGQWIYENFIEKNLFDTAHVINEHILNVLLTRDSIDVNKEESIYFYDLIITSHENLDKGEWEINKFRVKTYDSLLQEQDEFIAYVFRNENNFKSFIKNIVDNSLTEYLDRIIEKDEPRNMLRHFQDWFMKSYSLHDIKYDCKEAILGRIFGNTFQSLHRKLGQPDFVMDDYLQVIDLYGDLGVSLKPKDLIAIKELLNSFILNGLAKMTEIGIENFDFTDLIKTIQTARRANLEIDYEEIMPIVRNNVLTRMNEAIINRNFDQLKRIEKLIDFTNISGMDFEKYEIQNLLYDTLTRYVSDDNRNWNKETEKTLFRLASKFNISTIRFENLLKSGK